LHALVLDGVFHETQPGERPALGVARRLQAADLDDVLQAARVKILGLARRRGALLSESGPEASDAQPSLLAGLPASAIAGRQVTRVGDWTGALARREPHPDCVEQEGFGASMPGYGASRFRGTSRAEAWHGRGA
jgi:hypothetical protein